VNAESSAFDWFGFGFIIFYVCGITELLSSVKVFSMRGRMRALLSLAFLEFSFLS
jgi:hypothetical protein